VALEYFSGAIDLPLMSGVDDDPISDVSFHGRLQGGCVLGHSLPVRAGSNKAPAPPQRRLFLRAGFLCGAWQEA
jgi:hypothetical protein